MVRRSAWANGELLCRVVKLSKGEALKVVDEHNQNHVDDSKAKWFQRTVKAGRTEMPVWMVVIRKLSASKEDTAQPTSGASAGH